MNVIDGFCFFKQKTAYELRISDWSSDVCSSDLPAQVRGFARGLRRHAKTDAIDAETIARCLAAAVAGLQPYRPDPQRRRLAEQIGRASCRARVCQYV